MMLPRFRIVSVFRNLFRKSRVERDLDQEVRSYADMLVDEKLRSGAQPEAARREALMELGGVEQVKEQVRESKAGMSVESLAYDLRHGVRLLIKSPAFTLVATLSLALGIGANTAIFQLLDVLRIRTLPVPQPQQLSEIFLTSTKGIRGSTQSSFDVLTNPVWEQIRDRRPEAFSGVLAWAEDGLNIAPKGQVRNAAGLWVSGDFFRVLGVQPIMGRVFTAADDRRGCGLPGAVVSYSFWQRELGGDRAAVGRRISLDFQQVQVIGVTPRSFAGLDVGQSFDVAMPICSQAALQAYSFLDDGTIWWLTVMGRLRPGVTLQSAAAELGAVSPGIFQTSLPSRYPRENVTDYLRFKLSAYPASNGFSGLRQAYQDPLWLLLATAGLVLLIACANLANLMLARASAREREIAVRLALGAPRGRVIRQLLAEGLVLAALGAGSGLLLAGILGRFLVSFLSTQGNPMFLDLTPDWRVFAFTVAVGALTCLLFGLAPALHVTRIGPGEAMKAGGRSLTASRERFGLRRALAVTQVALSLVLVGGALLFSRSLRNLTNVNPGFRPDGILIADADLTDIQTKLPAEARVPFKLQLLDRLRAIPGVASVADVRVLPLTGSGTDNIVWRGGSDQQHGKDSYFNSVSQDYFKTTQTPFLAGRDFDSRDTIHSPPVAIVNQAFVRLLGLGANPVGQYFRRQSTPSDPEMDFQIVGLVGDTRYRDIRVVAQPIAYLATSQDLRFSNYFVQVLIRSSLPASELTPQVRRAVAGLNSEISVDFGLFSAVLHDGMLRERLMATLSGFFGLLGVLLAVVGLYGVLSYIVVRRTNEIGIRMTLGANRREIVRMVLRESALVVLCGAGAGLMLLLILGRAVRSLLFGLQPTDPITLGAAVALLAVVALAAGFLPARRAARLDPMDALRVE
jgi:putative ABC transport system permease protein